MSGWDHVPVSSLTTAWKPTGYMTPSQIKRAMGEFACKGHGNYARGLAEIPATGNFAIGHPR